MTTFGTIKEGYLTKSGENNASWKKRYFTIQDDLIYYFASKTVKKKKFYDLTFLRIFCVFLLK